MGFDSETAYYGKAQEGKAFIISDVYNVAAGGTANIHLKNPESSGKQFWIMAVTISSDGPYIGEIYDAFSSAPSGGSDFEIENVLLDSEGDTTDDGVADANENVTFTPSGSHAVGVGGGGVGGNDNGALVQHPPLVMQSGREIVLEVENTGSGPNNYGLTILYYEKPTSQ